MARALVAGDIQALRLVPRMLRKRARAAENSQTFSARGAPLARTISHAARRSTEMTGTEKIDTAEGTASARGAEGRCVCAGSQLTARGFRPPTGCIGPPTDGSRSSSAASAVCCASRRNPARRRLRSHIIPPITGLIPARTRPTAWRRLYRRLVLRDHLRFVTRCTAARPARAGRARCGLRWRLVSWHAARTGISGAGSGHLPEAADWPGSSKAFQPLRGTCPPPRLRPKAAPR